MTIFLKVFKHSLTKKCFEYITKQPCNNIENLHIGFQSSPTQLQYYNTPLISRNASANKLEK